MSEWSTFRQSELSARLTDNPYDILAALEQVVLFAEQGQLQLSQEFISKLMPWLGPGNSTNFLSAVSTGELNVTHTGQAYIATPAGSIYRYCEPEELLLLEKFADHIGLATEKVAAIMGGSAPTVIGVVLDSIMSPYSIRFTNGFGFVVVSRDQLAPHDIAPLTAHEVTHCALCCGHPFLDEGLATYFELKQTVKAEQGGRQQNMVGKTNKSLRTLLQPIDDRQWFDWVNEQSQRLDLYNYGAGLIDWLIENRGGASVLHFFENAPSSIMQKTLAIDFEKHFDIALEVLEKILDSNRSVENAL